MKVSFIIPAYNEERYIADCLSALATEIALNGAHIDTEVVVVNNASTDKTAEIARQFKNVSVVDEPSKGVARARQKGLYSISGEITAYVDADTKVTPGWIPTMLGEFSAYPEVVAISGPYIYYDLPGVWGKLAWPYQAVVGRVTEFFTGQWVFGGNFAARTSALLAVGGFDTSIVFYGEDQNIVQRLKKIGKFKFTRKLQAYSSARRFNQRGVLRTVCIYAFNFIWVSIFKHAPSMRPDDVR